MLYDEIRTKVEEELGIEMEPGDLLAISFPYKDKDKVAVFIFDGVNEDGSVSYAYSLSAGSFNWEDPECDLLLEEDTAIELCGRVVPETPARFTAAQAIAIATDWEHNGIGEHVDEALKEIQRRAKAGYFQATISDPPSFEANWDVYVEIMKSLGYILKQRGTYSHVWGWGK